MGTVDVDQEGGLWPAALLRACAGEGTQSPRRTPRRTLVRGWQPTRSVRGPSTPRLLLGDPPPPDDRWSALDNNQRSGASLLALTSPRVGGLEPVALFGFPIASRGLGGEGRPLKGAKTLVLRSGRSWRTWLSREDRLPFLTARHLCWQ